MNDMSFRIPEIPFSEIVVRELALVQKNDSAAEVFVETRYPPIGRIGHEPRGRSTSTCTRARTWTFSGSHVTDSRGIVVIKLTRFLSCIDDAIDGVIYSEYIGSLPSFVATPKTDSAVFVTTQIDAVALQPPPQQVFSPEALDVTVTLKSWRHDGTAAPGVEVNWIAICRIGSVTNF